MPTTFAGAIAVAGAVFFIVWVLLGAQGLKPEAKLTSQTLFDIVKLSFGVVAGAGALVALIVAYRRQRVDEDAALREATRLHTERFTTAVSQLGDDSPAVRLGGVHALAHLADDAPTRALRQTCIDVTCAYLRLPYTAEANLPPEDAAARHAYLALREVRHTIIRLIRDHLRLSTEHAHSWQGHDLDFTNAVFDGGNFDAAKFSGGTVSFDGAIFSGGTVSLDGGRFSGGTVSFDGADFSGGTVSLDSAVFSGSEVTFNAATFSGSVVTFNAATFSSSPVSFSHAKFSGGRISFSHAELLGGSRYVRGTIDNGGLGFGGATFSGSEVTFTRARFGGSTVSFAGARFSDGTVSFDAAAFSDGSISFDDATFSGSEVNFNDAAFFGSLVSFEHAHGEAPHGLVPSSGESLAQGLTLPPTWLP
ncbi:pentapeptide repeat-containing protein [Streptomyces sp. NPDC098781]|uniref:pentapeptide repeat-containing protein n=1 Tax=Streptomyces sp. NPDC098781 TaxID=3366097 RepID=UPI00381422DB